MGTIQDVFSMLGDVTEGISDIKSIISAVDEGKEYLSKRYPDVKKDLGLMCREWNKTLRLIAMDASILTSFSFVIDKTLAGTELRKFDDEVRKRIDVSGQLRSQIHDLRSHCHVIAQHKNNIEAGSLMDNVFSALGIHSAERNRDLSDLLQKLLDEEAQAFYVSGQMSEAVDNALQDIRNTLGPPGQMLPDNLPAAADKLSEYSQKFLSIQNECNFLELQIEQMTRNLIENDNAI
ncbi:MAG: hypothetical protein KAI29_24745 [Cyclobacteriaceae bacterium]|nr:hypothetical protein [Cyclobacteriaceae bacterium]MCK5704395.1 hypothetical protein [Cyclobacteriaceae bacterium]